MESILIDDLKNSVLTVGKNQSRQFVIFITNSLNLNLEISLTGIKARAEILGIVIAKNKNVIRLNTIQHHLAPETKSSLLIKTIADDDSFFNFSGLIKIDKKAQKSQAYQRNENILLSLAAHVESKPYLEILANDVYCTHGATMGEVDKEQLFYLQSRGLDKTSAKNLVINGFLHSLLDKISDLSIVERVNNKLRENGYGSVSPGFAA